MTHVAGAVFMSGTSRSSSNPIHVLVAFGGVLRKVDARAEHAADVGVALVEALVDDCIDEGRTWPGRDRSRITSNACKPLLRCSLRKPGKSPKNKARPGKI